MIYNSTRDYQNENYTMEELAEMKIIRIVKGITEDKTITPDDYGLTNQTKEWN